MNKTIKRFFIDLFRHCERSVAIQANYRSAGSPRSLRSLAMTALLYLGSSQALAMLPEPPPKPQIKPHIKPAQKIPTTVNKLAAKPVPPKTLSPLDRAKELQKQYDKTKSASMSFSQSYKHPIFPHEDRSLGRIFYKEENMMWAYDVPADRKRVFHIEKDIMTYHLVSEKLAYINKCFKLDAMSAATTFLGGKGKLLASFHIHAATDPTLNKNLNWILLVPKEVPSAVKNISLGLDAASIVKESVVIDANDGRNHFQFSDYKANPVLADSLFHFVPEKGVRVEDMPNIKCPEKKPAPPAKKAPIPAAPDKGKAATK